MRSVLWNLMKSRRFLPLFLVQFLQAFNDNLLKNALLILVTFNLAESAGTTGALLALASATLIFPFFIFSAIAGRLADKYNKAFLIRIIKGIEIVGMFLAALGFLTQHQALLFCTLFLMGAHSAFFGPIKYAILPDHLSSDELIAGNAWIESSTFLAILLGTILGASLYSLPGGDVLISTIGVAVAFAGLAISFWVPKTERAKPDLNISFNVVRSTWRLIEEVREHRSVFIAILAISWFWLLGAILLAELSGYAKNLLGAGPSVVTWFLSAFSIGIAVGSFLCERLQKGEVSAKYVPIGVLFLSIFVFDLCEASRGIVPPDHLLSLAEFLAHPRHWRISLDFFAIALSGGFYVVPLYAIVQQRTPKQQRARAVAANNVLNAFFMVGGSLSAALLLFIGVSVINVFFIFAFVNLGVTIYLFRLLPDEFVKTIVRGLFQLCFRVQVKGLSNYYEAGSRVVIVANHISLLDGVLLAAFLPKRTLFAIHSHFMRQWWFKPFLSLIDAFALDPENPMAAKTLIDRIHKNEPCVIFPEGRLTVTGALMKVYEGPGMIADKADAQILPVRIDGAQYTVFSRLRGKVRIRWFPQITITLLPPRRFEVAPHLTGRQRRHAISMRLYDLMTDMVYESSHLDMHLFESFIDATRIYGRGKKILEDTARKKINYQGMLNRAFILGNHFRENVKGEGRVGLLLPNCVAAVASFYGLHLANSTPVMLNFTTGPYAVSHACKTAKVKTVYTSSVFVEKAELGEMIQALEENGCRVVYLEDVRAGLSFYKKLRALICARFPYFFFRRFTEEFHPDNEAVVLFTSGSEGSPKGVVLAHRNIQANRYQVTSRIDFHSEDVLFNALPMFHSMGLMGGMFIAMLSGVRTFLYPSPLHYRVIPELVYDTNATIIFGTDTFMCGYARSAHPYDFYSMRYVFCGAEPLRPETRRLYMEKFGIRVFEAYGTTETAPGLALNTPMQNQPGTVGRFLPKVEYRLEPVEGLQEAGGRLFVRGPNVMKGYIRAEHPDVVEPPPDGWYDTGDIVSVDDWGYVSIVGRLKRFAKIGGEMVSLTAVENGVSKLSPEALHGALCAPDARRGEQIILVTSDDALTREKVATHFRALGLSEIFLPKRIVYLKEIPLLGTGKINYPELKKMVL